MITKADAAKASGEAGFEVDQEVFKEQALALFAEGDFRGAFDLIFERRLEEVLAQIA